MSSGSPPHCRHLVSASSPGPPCLPSSSPVTDLVVTCRMPLLTTVLRMMVLFPERWAVRSLHSLYTWDDRDDGQRRQLIQFYSLTKHNLQTTHNPAGATARTAIRLTRATQSPLRTPAGNRLQTSSARVQDFLLNISYSRVNTHSHTVFRLPRQPSTACLLDRVLHHCFSHTGFPQTALVATQLPTHCFVPTVNQLS